MRAQISDILLPLLQVRERVAATLGKLQALQEHVRNQVLSGGDDSSDKNARSTHGSGESATLCALTWLQIPHCPLRGMRTLAKIGSLFQTRRSVRTDGSSPSGKPSSQYFCSK